MLTRRSPIFAPLEQLNRMTEEMDRLFGNGWTVEPVADGQAWIPPMDVQETQEEIRCVLEVPGLAKDDLEITVNGNVLTISGEKRFEEQEGVRTFRAERRYGRFARSITLPVGVDGNSVRASYSDGVLRLTLPKKPEAKPRRIEIEGGSSSAGRELGTGA